MACILRVCHNLALLSYVLLLCYHCFTSADWQSLNEKAAQPVVLQCIAVALKPLKISCNS